MARAMLQVDTLAGIAAVTNNEVQLQHLGPRFASSAGEYIAQGIKSRPGSGYGSHPAFDMPPDAGGAQKSGPAAS